MTIRELISELEEYDQDRIVIFPSHEEGDDFNEVREVQDGLSDNGDRLLILWP